MIGRFQLSFILGLLAASARADSPPLLDAAIGNWTTTQSEWSFTRKTRSLNDKGRVKEERIEHYNPALSDDQRWQLVEINGRPPTEAELKAENKKNRKPRKYGSGSPGDFLDLAHATVRERSPVAVTFEVPVRTAVRGLAQSGKLVVLITVNRKTQTIERLSAQLLGPMRIALGLAKLTDVDLDLSVQPDEQQAKAEGNEASGTARVTLSAFGERMEYEWSELKRIEE